MCDVYSSIAFRYLLSMLLALIQLEFIHGQSNRPPNVILILADDLGACDLGCYGSTFHHTPNIDRLAASGIRLTNAYSASPLCSPTRSSILTGKSPARTGITAPNCHLPEVILEKGLTKTTSNQRLRIAQSLTRLSGDYVTIAERLQACGYRTGHFGKWHLGSEPFSPLEQGFEVDLPHTPGPGPGGEKGYFAPWAFWKEAGHPEEHIEDRMAQEASNFIARHKDQPFFLNYWAFSVHSPWMAKGDLTQAASLRIDPNNPQRNAMYAAMVESLDQAVGKLLDALKENQLQSNTLVLFTSDNGGWHTPPKKTPRNPGWESVPATSNAPFRSGKASLYEGGTRVPMIAAWPGVIAPGTTSDQLVQSTDLFATILQATQVSEFSTDSDSISALGVLRGEPSGRNEIYCHFPHGSRAQAASIDGFLPGTYIRQGDWKLIRFYADNPDGSDRLELYHLRQDPSETKNLLDQNEALAKSLNAKIDEYLVRTQAVVPILNPNYDPTTESLPKSESADPLLGFKARGCTAQVRQGVLIGKATSESPFFGYATDPKHSGKSAVTLELRNSRPGIARVHWLPEGIGDTPRIVNYRLQGGAKESVRVTLDTPDRIGILRLYFPDGATEFQIDRIAIESSGSKENQTKTAKTLIDW